MCSENVKDWTPCDEKAEFMIGVNWYTRYLIICSRHLRNRTTAWIAIRRKTLAFQLNSIVSNLLVIARERQLGALDVSSSDEVTWHVVLW